MFGAKKIDNFMGRPPTTTTQEHINAIIMQTIGREYIHNVYKLPSIKPTIRYLHVVAGFLVEETWLKVILRGNYNSWPLINVTNVARYFPESEETQKEHMHGQQQGVCSTKKKALNISPNTPTPPLHESKRDILICIYILKETMYSDQRGFSCKYLASATKTSWSFTMSTATLCGWRPTRKNQW